MRLSIIIDNIRHDIDSTDPELLGKWVVEIFGRAAAAGITPATYIQVQAQPSWIPDGESARADWIADGRIIGNMYQVHTPADLVAELSRQIDDARAAADA